MKKMIKGGDNISPSCKLYYNISPSCKLYYNISPSCKLYYNISPSCKLYYNISPSCKLYYNMVPPDAELPRQHKERRTDQCCLDNTRNAVQINVV